MTSTSIVSKMDLPVMSQMKPDLLVPIIQIIHFNPLTSLSSMITSQLFPASTCSNAEPSEEEECAHRHHKLPQTWRRTPATSDLKPNRTTGTSNSQPSKLSCKNTANSPSLMLCGSIRFFFPRQFSSQKTLTLSALPHDHVCCGGGADTHTVLGSHGGGAVMVHGEWLF